MITKNRISILKDSNKILNVPTKVRIIKQGTYHLRKKSNIELQFQDKGKENSNCTNKVSHSPQLKKAPSLTLIPIRKTDELLTDIERQNLNCYQEYGQSILSYLIEYEKKFPTDSCLAKHSISQDLRCKMVDWMIEVVTNFKCRELTFYLAVKIMDRFFKVASPKEDTDLHVVGVTSMFMASKYEDICPLRMQVVFEKIGHKKISIEAIKAMEKEIMLALGSTLGIPTSYEFIRIYFKYIKPNKFSDFIEQMSFYLSKVCLHDYELCRYDTSLCSAACIYVAYKICEQLNKVALLDRELVTKLSEMGNTKETVLLECSQKILNDAQNFDKLFGCYNLKKTHFVNLASFLNK